MSRAYGGKLGVWLTKKRKNKGPFKRHSSRKVAGSFLPGKFMSKLNKRNGNTAGTKQEMVGWDDVRCRPVYYNNEAEEEEDDLPKTDSESYSSEDDSVSLSFSNKNLGSQAGENGISSTSASQWAEWAKSDEIKTKINKKQTYGNQKKGGRLLSNMATSVLDHCASPIRKIDSKSYGNMRQRGRKRVGESNSSDRSISIHDGYTPSQPDNSVLCLDSNTDNQDIDCHCHNQEIIGSDNAESVTLNGRPVNPDDMQLPKDTRAKSDICMNSKKRKIRVKETHDSAPCKKQSVRPNSDGNGVHMSLRQPNFTTSLLEAKAYYDHLDATHKLRIE